MARAAKRASASRPNADPAPLEQEAPQEHLCNVGFCPICLAISTLQPLKPEVVEHLLSAGREMLLALKAVIDARAADDHEKQRGSTLERIDLT